MVWRSDQSLEIVPRGCDHNASERKSGRERVKEEAAEADGKVSSRGKGEEDGEWGWRRTVRGVGVEKAEMRRREVTTCGEAVHGAPHRRVALASPSTRPGHCASQSSNRSTARPCSMATEMKPRRGDRPSRGDSVTRCGCPRVRPNEVAKGGESTRPCCVVDSDASVANKVDATSSASPSVSRSRCSGSQGSRVSLLRTTTRNLVV
mmetsp:Transcript_1054/g.3224  ORF Transcript_1054/g.3224 Transcript_1054/m.3224 type:complete len:206 (+) Transcript_1054:165-782(+)